MALAYGTNAYFSMEHTGTQVRIAAVGPQAANVVGVTDQTDLFRMMLRAMSRQTRDAEPRSCRRLVDRRD
jgi:alkaline phosphatase